MKPARVPSMRPTRHDDDDDDDDGEGGVDPEGPTFFQRAIDEVISPLLTAVGTVGGLGAFCALIAGLVALCGAASSSANLLRAAAVFSGLGALGGLVLAVGAGVMGGILASGGDIISSVIENVCMHAHPCPTFSHPCRMPLLSQARLHRPPPAHPQEFPVRAELCDKKINHYAYVVGMSLVGLASTCFLGAVASIINVDATCKLANAVLSAADDPSEHLSLVALERITNGEGGPPSRRTHTTPSTHARRPLAPSIGSIGTGGRPLRSAVDAGGAIGSDSVELTRGPVVGCRLSQIESGLAMAAPPTPTDLPAAAPPALPLGRPPPTEPPPAPPSMPPAPPSMPRPAISTRAAPADEDAQLAWAMRESMAEALAEPTGPAHDDHPLTEALPGGRVRA